MKHICALLFGTLLPLAAVAADGGDTVARGEYLARAADCLACHTADPSRPYGGGKAIASPLGNIYAPNITPSKSAGIGAYSEADFTRAVREGRTPDGTHLYPAMPYSDYAGISDQDIHALYAYFTQKVKPLDEASTQHTDLPFPFNIRASMAVWNTLFLDKPAKDAPPVDNEIERGRYFADALAHCSTCHTPRNSLMASDKSQYLAGGAVGSWYAPNITPDPEHGIGKWSNEDLASYLKNGHNRYTSAAGPMAEAVSNSFNRLNDSDIKAMVSYLKSVPPKQGAAQVSHRWGSDKVQSDYATVMVSLGESERGSLTDHSTTDGKSLYMAACASCHAVNGKGSSDGFYPSLVTHSAVNLSRPDNLIMSISEGVHSVGSDSTNQMPAFGKDLTAEQIAAVSNYVIQTFGERDSHLTAADVEHIQNGGDKPWIISAAPYGIAAVVIVLMGIIWGIVARRRKRAAR